MQGNQNAGAFVADMHNAIASNVRAYSVMLEQLNRQIALEVQGRTVFEGQVNTLTERIRERDEIIQRGTADNERLKGRIDEERTRADALQARVHELERIEVAHVQQITELEVAARDSHRSVPTDPTPKPRRSRAKPKAGA